MITIGEVSQKVSVIVPAYNAQADIEKCINSILQQSYRNLEILVVDDGSTDKTRDILSGLAQKDQRIRVISQSNQGVSAARNHGLSIMTGEYLTFVDSDDYIGEQYIEHLMNALDSSNADMVICGLRMVDPNGEVLKEILPGEYIRGKKEEGVFRVAAVCSHLYKREIWDRYKVRFAEGVRGEDMPIALFFSAAATKICVLQEAEYYYVQHESSAMHQFQGLKKWKLPLKELERVVEQIQKLDLDYSEEWFELFALRIMATCVQLTRGASKEDIQELGRFLLHMLNNYFSDCTDNRLCRISSNVNVPLFQKMAVWLLVKSYQFHTLDLVLRIVC